MSTYDFKEFLIKEYAKEGITVDWASEYFEEDYTYDPLWKKFSRQFYNSFGKKYNIPLNWFLFKAFRDYDMAILWDTRGEINYDYLVNWWFGLSDILETAYPEISTWIRLKMKNPNKILKLPDSTIESDLKELMFDDDYRLRLEFNPLSSVKQDFLHILLNYGEHLKKIAKELEKSQQNK